MKDCKRSCPNFQLRKDVTLWYPLASMVGKELWEDCTRSLVTYNTLEGRLLKLFPSLIAYITLQSLSPCYVFHLIKLWGSLSNHDDDGNKNLTNLHIWRWKTVFLHALHVHFSSFDLLRTFSFFLRREMTCFAVVWTTWAYDDKCSILSSIAPSAGSN